MVNQQYRWVVFIAVFLLSSVYFFIFSESGLLERIILEKEKGTIAANIRTLKSENNRLQRLLNKYRRGEYSDGDLQNSGYIKNGGKIIFFRGLEGQGTIEKEKTVQSLDFPVPLPYLRILWIGISSIIVIVMVLYGKKLKDQTQ